MLEPEAKYEIGDIVRVRDNAYISTSWRSIIRHGDPCIITSFKLDASSGSFVPYAAFVTPLDGKRGDIWPWMYFTEIEHDPFLMAVRKRRHA